MLLLLKIFYVPNQATINHQQIVLNNSLITENEFLDYIQNSYLNIHITYEVFVRDSLYYYKVISKKVENIGVNQSILLGSIQTTLSVE